MRAPLPRRLRAGTYFVTQPIHAVQPKRLRREATTAASLPFLEQLCFEPLVPAKKRKRDLEHERPELLARLNSRRVFVPTWIPATWVRESLSASGVRAEFATSPCRRCTPKLPRLLRNSGLRGRAKLLRCETLPELPATRPAPRFEFRARRVARRACRRRPEFPGASALLPAPRQSKRFSA